MNKTRNILIVGKTGAGKSTLANVITGTNKFQESEGFGSRTEFFQQEILDHKEIKYRIVDTIGVDDNRGLDEKEVLFRIAQGVCMMEDGLTQIFFVIDGRFTTTEVQIFESIKKIVFDKGVIRFITIIRTKFAKFDDSEECERETINLKDRQDAIGEIARSCNGIVYVNNPSLDIEIKENFNEMLKRKKRQEIETNSMNREISREILLEYFNKTCQSFYCPGYWQRIKLNTYAYISEKLQVEERIKAEEKRKVVEQEVQERLEIERKQERLRKEAEEAKNKAVEAAKKELKAEQMVPPKGSSSSSRSCGCIVL